MIVGRGILVHCEGEAGCKGEHKIIGRANVQKKNRNQDIIKFILWRLVRRVPWLKTTW